jgi:hypothetical protein
MYSADLLMTGTARLWAQPRFAHVIFRMSARWRFICRQTTTPPPTINHQPHDQKRG